MAITRRNPNEDQRSAGSLERSVVPRGTPMTEDAKRRMMVLHQSARWPLNSVLEEAFQIGFEEGWTARHKLK